MSVDASARARVLGVATEYQDLREGSIQFLPQRLLVVAQGSTASAGYTNTKFTAESAGQVGSIAGYGSPAHLILRELYPANGDGIGTIAVDVCLLDDHGSGVASAGDITPSGTASAISTYWARIGGILSEAFTIAAGAIDVTDVCHDLGQAISAVPHMPVVQGWTYDTLTEDHTGNTGAGTVTAMSASATTTVPGDWTLVCTAGGVGAGTFTLTDPDGVVASTTVTATTTPGTSVDESGLAFTLMAAGADFIVGDTFTITVPALTVTVTSKWKGASANGIVLEMIDSLADLTFALTQPTGGATNPTVDAALAQVGDVWNTMGLNALEVDDETALNTISTWGEGRWDQLVAKPLVFFVGNTDTTKANAVAISETRTTDRVNSQLNCPGSPNLPFVVAARQLARIAKLANEDPPHDYGSQQATGLIPGNDGDQWNYTTRDQALKAGCSTIEVKDSVVNISDVVTMYAPAGDENPAYRYVCDIVKLQQCLYNTSLIFATPEWDGAPLIPDDQVTVHPSAKKPMSAKAEIAAMIDDLGTEAIISNTAAAKASITAAINGSNAKRLDTEVTFALSGNTNIVSHTQKFGFYFG